MQASYAILASLASHARCARGPFHHDGVAQ
jgi:hypothetical protein